MVFFLSVRCLGQGSPAMWLELKDQSRPVLCALSKERSRNLPRVEGVRGRMTSVTPCSPRWAQSN